MKKRGKVLRDTNAGDGLVFIEGQQYPFSLEGVWRSDVVPTVGMVVEVEFGDENSILSIQAISETQLAKEQAEIALDAAKEKASQITSGLVAKFGTETLVAMGLLVVGWFFLNTFTTLVPWPGPWALSTPATGFSFWRLLELLNSRSGVVASLSMTNGSAGYYGWFALAALVAPLTHYFWKDPRAYLGSLLPLTYIIATYVMIGFGFSNGVKQMLAENGVLEAAVEKYGNNPFLMGTHFFMEAMHLVSFGVGAYVSTAVSLYFAGKGAIKYLASRA